MIARQIYAEVSALLQEVPAVALLGPRQIGKTTLAHALGAACQPAALYLDLEDPQDIAALAEPSDFLRMHQGRLIILDEVQRLPEIFPVLRGVIDRRRRAGEAAGQFLILGSASPDLLRQSSESLAGRLTYRELTGIEATEIAADSTLSLERLWLRGGYPGSLLARSEAASARWRADLIRAYLERDIPQLQPRLPATLLRRLWTMLGHAQGSLLNVAQLALALDVAPRTVKRYIELLEDLFLVRSLPPWFGNIGKRLTKTPKVYLRDSGLLHSLLALGSTEKLLGHAVCGFSWEGFVLENLLASLPREAVSSFYRTQAGAEVDLVVEYGSTQRLAVEIKRSSHPKLSRGFHAGCQALQATQQFVVHSGPRPYRLSENIVALPLVEMMAFFRQLA